MFCCGRGPGHRIGCCGGGCVDGAAATGRMLGCRGGALVGWEAGGCGGTFLLAESAVPCRGPRPPSAAGAALMSATFLILSFRRPAPDAASGCEAAGCGATCVPGLAAVAVASAGAMTSSFWRPAWLTPGAASAPDVPARVPGAAAIPAICFPSEGVGPGGPAGTLAVTVCAAAGLAAGSGMLAVAGTVGCCAAGCASGAAATARAAVITMWTSAKADHSPCLE